MPNPKMGTVTRDVAKAVRDAQAGSVPFRVDKKGIVVVDDVYVVDVYVVVCVDDYQEEDDDIDETTLISL